MSELTLKIVIAFDSTLLKLARTFLREQKGIKMTLEEFKAAVDAKFQAQQAASESEHQEVLAVIEALREEVENTADIPDDAAQEILAKFDAAIEGIGNIYIHPTP